MRPLVYVGAIAIAGSIFVACAGHGANVAPTPPTPADQTQAHGKRHRVGISPIQHIFVIVQENRTVDNLFQFFPGANTTMIGRSGNSTVTLVPEPIASNGDLGHFVNDFNTDTGCPPVPTSNAPCPMNGFEAPVGGNPRAYAFVDPQYTVPYYQMGESYAFGDNMFPSNLDASFVSHQYLIAGQSHMAANIPGGICPNGTVSMITGNRQVQGSEVACWTSLILADELNAAGLGWRYYAAPAGSGYAFWNPYNYNANYTNSPNVILKPSQFITDVKSGSYNAAVTWITPTLKNSDHVNGTTNNGPNWVGSVVNAIGTSSLWNSSAIFITWDDWGGWYDHVSPPYKDYDGLGVRVPFIIISPYTAQGLVTHTQYEQASILKFIEDQYGLPQMAPADHRATDPQSDVFSNTGPTPRPFATFSVPSISGPDDAGDPDANG